MEQSDSSPCRIAVIGAGIAGLTCAKTLGEHGFRVSVFEKSRGIGGRMATRRTCTGLQFDHGAQYFTVRDDRFREFVTMAQEAGTVMPWEGRICVLENGQVEESSCCSQRMVGVPGMNGLCRQLSIDLDIRLDTQIVPPRRNNRMWKLADREQRELGEYDWLVVSAPAPQAVDLLEEAPELAEEASSVLIEGCWAAMLSFDNGPELGFDAAFVNDSPLSWIARNSSKPGREDNATTWVLHASPDWSRENIHREVGDVLPELLDAFWQATRAPQMTPGTAVAHRWRYAIPIETLEEVCLFDPTLQVGACGDWCNGARVEAAFLSGLNLANRIIASGR